MSNELIKELQNIAGKAILNGKGDTDAAIKLVRAMNYLIIQYEIVCDELQEEGVGTKREAVLGSVINILKSDRAL